MWGHTRECGCGICACFPRVFALVALGNPSPGYVPWAADRLRLLEADLRDELQRRGAPAVLTQANTPLREPEGPATTPAPSAATGEAKALQELQSKGRPPAPPKGLHPEPAAEVKTETATADPPEPTAPKEEAPISKASSSHKGPSESRRHQRSKSSKRRRSRRRSRSRRDRSRRDRRRSSRRRGGTPSPRGSQGDRKERKSRTERPPEPPGPPPGRHYQERPPEPPYPPPRGRGWVGPVPRSDHPRWHNSENKGIVKRAKQERFNQRRRRDRRR